MGEDALLSRLNVLSSDQRRLVKDALRTQLESDASAGARRQAASEHEREVNIGFSRENAHWGGLNLSEVHQALNRVELKQLTERLIGARG